MICCTAPRSLLHSAKQPLKSSCKPDWIGFYVRVLMTLAMRPLWLVCKRGFTSADNL